MIDSARYGMSLFLYSVNPWVSYNIGSRYRGGRYKVWCSSRFDARREHPLADTAMVPRSSNPAEIYRAWQDDVRRCDKHSELIARVRSRFRVLAVDWLQAGEITQEQRDDILYLVGESPDFTIWRPLLYVIERRQVEPRLRRVGPGERAGVGPEFAIDDLSDGEFDVLELE